MVLASCRLLWYNDRRFYHRKDSDPMKKRQKSPAKLILCIFICVMLLILLSAGILYLKIYEPGKRTSDFDRFQQESYQGVFLSMSAPEAFPEDIYPTYMGYDVVRGSHRIASFADLSDYLEIAFSSGNEVAHVFLVLDPISLWNSSLHRDARFSASLDEDLLSYVDTYTGAEFTVIFSAPSLEYWQAHANGDLETYCNVFRVLASPLSTRENVTLYFPGQEEWLLSNPDAYDTPTEFNAEAARSVMLLVLSGSLQYRNAESYNSLDHFCTMVQDAVTSPADYPDLSGCELVFFGDSVMGNYHDFASIPGVIHALTGATVHNLAIGGSSATRSADDDNSFPNVVQDFLDHNAEELSGDKKLCFLINYGLNDYFEGYSVDDYQNGLRTGIRSLRESYPDARIMVVSSNYILSFEKGMARIGADENVLEDYIAAAEETAAAENVDFLNINDALQWNENNAAEYLADSIHPNEEGRFLFGVEVIRALHRLISSPST